MTDKELRAYLEKEAKESKDAVSLDSLDDIVESELAMSMTNMNARSRMQTLFVDYHSILTRQGIAWTIKYNQKLAITHVLSAVKPKSLRERLQAYLSFSRHDLRKNFQGFLSHAIKLSETFQIVDAVLRKRRKDAEKWKVE